MLKLFPTPMRLGFQSDSTVMHATLGAGQMRAVELGDTPDEQVSQTLRIMSARASEDAANPRFREHAERVFAGVPASEKLHRAFEHVSSAIRFQGDEATSAGLGEIPGVIEFIIRPVDMAQYVEQGKAVGDCDDFSMYLACLLATQGIDTKFCTVAADPNAPGQFSHVYVVAYVDGERIPMDASHGDYVGWEVPNRFNRRKEWQACGGCDLFSLAAFAATMYFGLKFAEART